MMIYEARWHGYLPLESRLCLHERTWIGDHDGFPFGCPFAWRSFVREISENVVSPTGLHKDQSYNRIILEEDVRERCLQRVLTLHPPGDPNSSQTAVVSLPVSVGWGMRSVCDLTGKNRANYLFERLGLSHKERICERHGTRLARRVREWRPQMSWQMVGWVMRARLGSEDTTG